MAKRKQERTTLHSPDGRPYETADPAEITRLKARGYTEPKARKSSSTSSSSSSSGSSGS